MNHDPQREPDEAERLIAQAVRSMPLPPLPADFAAQVAAQVDEETPRLTWDLILLYGLLLTLCVSGLFYFFGSLGATALAGKPTLALALVGLYLMVQFSDSLARIAGVRTPAAGQPLP